MEGNGGSSLGFLQMRCRTPLTFRAVPHHFFKSYSGIAGNLNKLMQNNLEVSNC